MTARRRASEAIGGTARASRERRVERSGLRELFHDVAFADFDEVIKPFGEELAWQALSILGTRTARCIALSPLRALRSGGRCSLAIHETPDNRHGSAPKSYTGVEAMTCTGTF